MATKPELIATLETYDVSTLERLVTLAGMIIVPDEDQLVKVTFEQMVAKAHSLADIYFPEWTDRSKADFGQFLIELMALFSEKDFWYINAFANEGFLQKATTYKALYYHAKRLGYDPQLLAASRVNIVVDFNPGPETIISAGSIEISINDVVFSNYQEVTIQESVTAIQRSIEFGEGVVRGDVARYNGKSVRINQTGIEISSLTQKINGLSWVQVDTFVESSSSSRSYLVLPGETGIEIEYGDGEFGLRPDVQSNVITKFRLCNGTSGNFSVTSEMEIVIDQQPTGRTITAVTPTNSPSGGLDAESKESIRLNAPFRLKTGDRIINPTDCIDILEQYSDILKAHSYSGLNTIYFSVIPTTETYVTPDLTAIENKIAEKLLVGFDSKGLSTVFYELTEFTMTAYFLAGYDLGEGEFQMRTIIEDFTSPWGSADYGVGLDLALLNQELLTNVSGLQSVIFHTINGVTATNIVLQSHEILKEIEEANLLITINTL